MNLVHSEVGVRVSVEREKVRFASGDTDCAAWHYPGTKGACVIMAGGFAVTKEPGTDLFAKRFNVAARNPELAAAIAQSPTADGQSAARSALRLGFYRPGRYASRVPCPLLVLACDQDQSALPGRPAPATADSALG